MKRVILTVAQKKSKSPLDFISQLMPVSGADVIEIFIESPGSHPVYEEVTKTCCKECTELKCKETKSFETAQLPIREPDKQAVAVHTPGLSLTTCYSLSEVLQKIQEESRHADFMMVDPAISFKSSTEDLPTHFIKDILKISECPVLLVPGSYHDITDIVFCYDGKASGAYALKQFTYLFPGYSDKNIVILQVHEKQEASSEDLSNRLLHWLKLNYKTVKLVVLEGEVEHQLPKYFRNKKNLMVVMGAYGRTELSNFFKESTAISMIKNINLPIFITHR